MTEDETDKQYLSHNEHTNADPELLSKHTEALQALCALLPPISDLHDILLNQSRWWEYWRDAFGLSWGEETDQSFEDFAIRAFRSGDPCLLGSLLVCLALGVGIFEQKYLSAVERWILYDDDLAGCENGLECLMRLGLCYFSAMQHHRAWSVYRRANTLLQLQGIHRAHRESNKLDGIFWQLFHADRWLSLTIGLPYSVPNGLCDLYIPPVDSVPFSTFHHRHLAILTSRVIDCIQATTQPSLSTISAIDEQIDAVAAHLPPHYLDITHVSNLQDTKEKYTRIYRLTQVHQLKAYLHLPLFLQRLDLPKRRYGREVCANSSRLYLEAFLLLCGDDPQRASTDNSVKLTGFSAFTAAVTLFLAILDNKRGTTKDPITPSEDNEYDETLIKKTMETLQICSAGNVDSLCGRCLTALNGLVSVCQETGYGTVHKVNLPYFGVLSIMAKASGHLSISGDSSLREQSSAGFPDTVDDIFWSYEGPLASYDLLSPDQFSSLLEGI
ncbi:hypothetical protein N7457_004981 [Penicillium paradoxum]|uniref:uncharacterized protein n=1 Tax=Penicillium paradoxum TaxID=176176 RepID=UPI0025468933|nr:uncharacterized protein N7457_004981 [Penicillium paradoxum]KAJ5783207.1 hypothetical protein N7457_004981 [Penicillium paradoxum]